MSENSFQKSCWFWGDGLSDSDYTAKLREPAVALQIKGVGVGAGKMAQQLRALAALAEDLGLVHRIYTVWSTTACNSSSRNLTPSSGFHWHYMHRAHTYVQANSHM